MLNDVPFTCTGTQSPPGSTVGGCLQEIIVLDQRSLWGAAMVLW